MEAGPPPRPSWGDGGGLSESLPEESASSSAFRVWHGDCSLVVVTGPLADRTGKPIRGGRVVVPKGIIGGASAAPAGLCSRKHAKTN